MTEAVDAINTTNNIDKYTNLTIPSLEELSVDDWIVEIKKSEENGQLESMSALRTLATQWKHMRSLLSISTKVAKKKYHCEDIDEILNLAKTVLEAERVIILKYDKSDNQLVVAATNESSIKGIKLPINTTSEGEVFRTGIRRKISDVRKDSTYISYFDNLLQKNTKSVISHPITVDGYVIGIIEASNKLSNNGRSFSVYDEKVLEYISCQISILWHQTSAKERLSQFSVKALSSAFPTPTEATNGDGTPDLYVYINKLIEETYQRLDADRISLFTYNNELNQLECKISQDIQGMTIPVDRGIAGKVFSSLQIVNIADAKSDNSFYGEFDRNVGYQTRSLLCAPLLDFNGHPLGVIQAINKKSGENFTPKDVENLMTICRETSHFLQLIQSSANLLFHQQKHNHSNRPSLNYNNNNNSIISNNNKPVAEKKSVSSSNVNSPLPTPRENHHRPILQSSSSKAALVSHEQSREMIVSEEIEFTFGVLKSRLSNFGSRYFNSIDVVTSSPIVLPHHHASKLSPHYHPSMLHTIDLSANSFPGIFTWDFNVLEYSEPSQLLGIGMVLFNMFPLEDLGISFSTLQHYLISIAQHYHDCNPFHNFRHATTTTHFCYMLLSTLFTMGPGTQITDSTCDQPVPYNLFTPLQLFAIMVSAIVHDVDHPGNTNTFEINAQSLLAMRYNDSSVLENHHCSVAFQLMRHKGNNIFSNLSHQTANELRKIMVNSILATDMSVHFQLMDEIGTRINRMLSSDEECQTMVASKSLANNMNFHDTGEKILLAKLLLHASDLSNPVRPFNITRSWSELVTKEFHSQYQLEVALGLPCMPHMNVTNELSFCKGEVGFNQCFVLPMWKKLVILFDELQPILNSLESNLETWQQLIEKEMAKDSGKSPSSSS